MLFDYGMLRLIWWGLIGLLLIGFAVMDGFDMGAAALLPFVAKNDGERRIVINTVGPVWEGNQVWLILGAGSIFAAWPYLYAVAFSGFYLPMFMILGSLILRPAGFKFRGKMAGALWRSVWDGCLFLGGTVPPFIFGVAFGNAIEGVPFSFDDSMRLIYKGTFFGLLNPFALLCGLTGFSMIALQGACWLTVKTEGAVQRRARRAAMIFAALAPILFIAGGLWMATGIEGYRYASAVDPYGPSNPALKTVVRAAGLWMDNYASMPAIILAPVLALAGAAIALGGAIARRHMLSFFGSSLVQAGIIATAGLSMFPFLLPSSLDPNMSLTVWDASSSRMTLIVMTLMTAVFMPVVLAYTGWVYHVLRGKVTAAMIRDHGDSLY